MADGASFRKGSCRTCGSEIWWALTEHGKKIPLDYPERRFVKLGSGKYGVRVTYLAHFATCPGAKDWRGKTRKGKGTE